MYRTVCWTITFMVLILNKCYSQKLKVYSHIIIIPHTVDRKIFVKIFCVTYIDLYQYWSLKSGDKNYTTRKICNRIYFTGENIPIYSSSKYWLELNLVVGPQITIAKISTDFNLVIALIDRRTAKFNSPPKFSAIRI